MRGPVLRPNEDAGQAVHRKPSDRGARAITVEHAGHSVRQGTGLLY